MSDIVARATTALEGVELTTWELSRDQGGQYDIYANTVWGRRVAGLIVDRDEAEFIVAARGLVPDLLAEVKRLRNALADACIDQYMKDHGYTHIGKPPGTAGQETP